MLAGDFLLDLRIKLLGSLNDTLSDLFRSLTIPLFSLFNCLRQHFFALLKGFGHLFLISFQEEDLLLLLIELALYF